MSGRHFYLQRTRERVRECVARIEQQSGAEVRVAVRPRSAPYRETDYLVGLGASMVGLLVFLFHPAPFREDLFPVEAALLFVLGAIVSANVPDLRRWLTRRAVMTHAVHTAARAAMIDLGITRTRDRTGVLVFASVFERRVEVVLDLGLERLAEDATFRSVVEDLDRSIHPPDVDRFVGALERLGPVLAEHAPRRPDDVDELPNEMHAS